MRRAAAQALGEQGTTLAREALKPALHDKHSRVRRGASRALGSFRRDEDASRALKKVIRGEDKSDYVVAAALFGLAQTRDKETLTLLKGHLGRTSHNEILRTSALAALPELRDEKGLDLALERTVAGVHPYVRAAALSSAARLWDFVSKKRQDDIRDALTRACRDPSHPIRRAAYAASAEVPDGELARVLSAQADSEPIGLLKKMARESLRGIQEKLSEQARIGDVRKEFEQLQQEHKKLQARVAEIEGKLKAGRKPKKK